MTIAQTQRVFYYSQSQTSKFDKCEVMKAKIFKPNSFRVIKVNRKDYLKNNVSLNVVDKAPR